MIINIMIPDSKVSEMLASGKRIDGSLGLANSKEGNFNPYNHIDKPIDTRKRVYLLRCGRAVATENRFTLYLNAKRKNAVNPAKRIAKDCEEAGVWFKGLEN